MPAGLRTWDANGNLTLDYTSDLFKMLGIVSIGNSHTGTAASGSIHDPRLTQYAPCIPFFQVIGSQYANPNYPVIGFDGPNVVWNYPRAVTGSLARPDVVFVYGLF